MSSTNNNNLPIWVQKRDVFLEKNKDIKWRFGEQPDYSLSNQKLATESIYNHPQHSLADIVQNLVRSFDIEANFKIDYKQWLTVVQDKFYFRTNGGRKYKVEDLIESGTYKLLIGDTQHYKASEENFETSTNLFHQAFPNGFLWELVEVYSGPPTITFKWRHWGDFNGAYKDYIPTEDRIEVIGMTVVNVTEDFKLLSLENYYDNNNFLEKLIAGGKIAHSSQSKQVEDSIENSSSTYNMFLQFLKKIFIKKEKIKNNNLSKSYCPFAFLFE